MARPGGFAQIAQKDDGARIAIWGIYELHSAFQPIFAFDQSGKLKIAAFECLIRPRREGVPVSPYKFFSSIPREERADVETLTRNLHLLNAGKFIGPPASIFVNFDPSQFTKQMDIDNALRDMCLVLNEAKLEPERIVCELTEQKSASPLALKCLMISLRTSGFRIAVDDFGAEESDFDRIIQMDPDIVKFDAEWVIKLLNTAAGYSLLKSMINKVGDRGIQTVIEGVEEPWQLELSEKAGTLMVQGFGVAKPQIAPSEFAMKTSQLAEPASLSTEGEPVPIIATRDGKQSIFGRRH